MGDEPKIEPKEPPKNIEMLSPVCPHCGQSPVELISRRITMSDGVMLLIVFCANEKCLKLFGTSFMGFAQSRPSGLIVPS